MKSHLLSLLVVACTAIRNYGQGLIFVVPTASSNVDGNTYSFAGPAVNQPYTIRYQQMYSASEFDSLTNFGGGWVVNILCRGDATNGTSLGLYMPSVQVNLSTTQRAPDGLSPVFSENLGTDDTVVFSGRLDTDLDGGRLGSPEPFSFWIHLSKLFFYHPAAGNLLLDIRVFQGNTNTNVMIPIVFDAANVTNDSVSRVWWGDVNASTGLVETVGVVTEFNFWRNPKLGVQQQSNSWAVMWPANPPAVGVLPDTVLHSVTSLGPQAEWQAISNGIVTSNLTNTYTIPLNSAGATAYFRLVSTAPP